MRITKQKAERMLRGDDLQFRITTFETSLTGYFVEAVMVGEGHRAGRELMIVLPHSFHDWAILKMELAQRLTRTNGNILVDWTTGDRNRRWQDCA